jgi:glycosyltransferase involved in cell wall biosynthesis
MHADVRLRASAIAVAPLAVLAGWFKALRVAQKTRATIMHAHWVIPGGVIGAGAARSLPLVVSLHGSDVFIAERQAAARVAARAALGRARWVTACSEDLRSRASAIGADPIRSSVVPYGVDCEQFKPDEAARMCTRARLGIADNVPLVVAVGRLVRKKGFEYLIDAVAALKAQHPLLRVAIAGTGDLEASLRARALASGAGDAVRFLGTVPHHEVPALLAAADIAVAPSVHDEAGNVDGLPNTVMEILASGTPLVATPVGGISAVAKDRVTARIAPERDARALASAIDDLLRAPTVRATLGRQARDLVCRQHSWARVAEDFEGVYERALERHK